MSERTTVCLRIGVLCAHAYTMYSVRMRAGDNVRTWRPAVLLEAVIFLHKKKTRQREYFLQEVNGS